MENSGTRAGLDLGLNHSRHLSLLQLWLTFGASLSFLIIGLVRGYSASAIPSIEDIDPEIIQSSEQKSWIGEDINTFRTIVYCYARNNYALKINGTLA